MQKYQNYNVSLDYELVEFIKKEGMLKYWVGKRINSNGLTNFFREQLVRLSKGEVKK